ncbi:MAG: hypothetical protein QMD50_00370 [Patescibacteria group bacterium]|nr:hypothetical protein [Patescibacteria group bacterium]
MKKIKKIKTMRGMYFYSRMFNLEIFNETGKFLKLGSTQKQNMTSTLIVSEKPLPRPEKNKKLSGKLINLERGDLINLGLSTDEKKCNIIIPNCTFITRRTTYMPSILKKEAKEDAEEHEHEWITFQREDGSLIFVYESSAHQC